MVDRGEEGLATIKPSSTAPTPMVTLVSSILRRRARRLGLMWAPVFRWVECIVGLRQMICVLTTVAFVSSLAKSDGFPLIWRR